MEEYKGERLGRIQPLSAALSRIERRQERKAPHLVALHIGTEAELKAKRKAMRKAQKAARRRNR